MMKLRIAVVDAGTNSFLLLIAEKLNDHLHYLLDISTVVGLGHLKNGVIDDEALRRAQNVINTYHKLCDKYKVDKRVMVGTEIFRKVDKKYFRGLSEKFDESMVLSGLEEAKLSYLSVIEDDKFSRLTNPIVVDIGGGSVEFAYNGKTFTAQTFPLGAAVLTDKFVNSYPIGDQLNRATELLRDAFNTIPKNRNIVAIGGTGTTVTDLIDEKPFDPERVHGRFLKIEDVKTLYNNLCAMDLDMLSKLEGMEEGREKIIAAGVLILIQAVKMTNSKGCFVSVRGHRYTIAKNIANSKR